MFVSYDKNNIAVAASDHPISIAGNKTVCANSPCDFKSIVGKKISRPKKKIKDLRVAIVCNWNMPCGISTYTKYLVSSLKPMTKEIRIFSEEGEPMTPDTPDVVRCWSRGKSPKELLEKLTAWNPDFIIVQHEYGIFPNACNFLQFLQGIHDIPYVIAMHSVYEHLDKTICTSAVRNMIVHSDNAKTILRSHGHTNQVFVVPHGCLRFEGGELWNIFQTPYAVVQFGFGFFYKGVDRALKSIAHLKNTDAKFKDIFYCYICAENPHNTTIHDQYFYYLLDLAKELGLENNISIVRGYQDEKIINNYLRTAKLAIFPYVNNPNNVVYGASGAIRIAMANRIPIIASESHLFDDLEGVVSRPKDHLELAKEIDEVFSNDGKRRDLVERIDEHTKKFTWENTASKYLECYTQIK